MTEQRKFTHSGMYTSDAMDGGSDLESSINTLLGKTPDGGGRSDDESFVSNATLKSGRFFQNFGKLLKNQIKIEYNGSIINTRSNSLKGSLR